MVGSWRFSLSLLSVAALLLAATPVRALDLTELTEMETLLRDLGFDPGPVDGVVDADTTEAIRQYKDFALAPGAPEPSAALLDELRGVAAAFAALNADKANAKPAPPPLPDLGTAPEETPALEPVAEKVVVPPPPAPPKLKPVDAAQNPTPEPMPALDPAQEPAQANEAGEQVAALPPSEAETEPKVDPADEAQARIDAELAPYRQELDSGSLTPAALAKRFNSEGRKLLQTARYDDAILKFTVAIFLDPDFAGAYSNRGTAYQRSEQSELAQADFDKAKALGFGGFRLRDGSNPLN